MLLPLMSAEEQFRSCMLCTTFFVPTIMQCEIWGSDGGAAEYSAFSGFLLCRPGNSFRSFEESKCHHLQVQQSKKYFILLVGLFHPKMKALQSFAVSITIYHSTWCYVLESLHFSNRFILQPLGTRWCRWFMHSTTSRKVTSSNSCGVIGISHSQNPSSQTMVLRPTQRLTDVSTRKISWG